MLRQKSNKKGDPKTITARFRDDSLIKLWYYCGEFQWNPVQRFIFQLVDNFQAYFLIVQHVRIVIFSMKSKYWYYLFFADLLAELTAIAMQWNTMQFITKPLLVIFLFAWFMASSAKGLPLRYFIAAALFFSWLGDVCLLMEAKNPGWFMAGLASFLLAHIIYILFFLQLRKKQPLPKPLNIFVVALVAVYAVSLFIFLYPHIGNLKLPVGIYAITISTMLVTAVHAFNKYNSPAARCCITGAALFVMSDSLLAVNKFYCSFTGAGIIIMLTYALAQFAIVKGSLHYLAAEKTSPAEN